MNKTTHLTVDDLILFMDRELDGGAAAAAEQHLLHCGDCVKRLRSLKNGSNAYAEYREQVLEPALAVPTRGWADFHQISKERQRLRLWGWGVACAFALALVFVFLRVPKQPNAQEVLTRAAAAPEQATGSLLLTSGGERLFRPAVLESGNSEARFQHVRALFVQAHYNWEKPLSARSFTAWRRGLAEKEDSVTSLWDERNRRFYRVQTRTSAGILRTASLTLQADSYHATKADFAFLGEEPMELAEQTEPPKNGLEEVRTIPPAATKRIETPATPEDELRVFAALDAMGAEAEEPIDVKLDAEHNSVLVTGVGIAPTRRKEIETAMAGLRHAVVRFSSGRRKGDDADSVSTASSDAADESLAFRQSLQDRYGGARQLQAATDKALDASNGLFARTHLLLLLAREFPPTVEAELNASSAASLLGLRQRHVGAMGYALRELKEELSPLQTEAVAPGEAIPKSSHWQSGAEDLFAATRNLDRLVSRLLAGRYSEQEGGSMLKELPSDLANVETLLRAQTALE